MRRGDRNIDGFRPTVILLGWLALVALITNVSVLQTHRYAHHHDVRVSGPADPATVSAAEEQCALCDASAAFEPLMTAGGTAFSPAPVFAAILDQTASVYSTRTSLAHDWLSRAPPEISAT